jgi:low temperature requirement protein LtrA
MRGLIATTSCNLHERSSMRGSITMTSRWYRAMTGRSPHEPRAATQLELFFDLTFVVAIALAASELHHELTEGHIGEGLLDYGLVFFGIWWAWVNFTWFASAYDTDDVAYRLTTMVQMAGALILAAGVPRAFVEDDYTLIVVGYVVMRLALSTQWLRAAKESPYGGVTERRYAFAVIALQAVWITRLLLGEPGGLATFLLFGALELLAPVWAESARPTPWNREHIVERYGLFTIIVLGEAVLAATIAVQIALDSDAKDAGVIAIAAGGLLIIFSMWWLYFQHNPHDIFTSQRAAFAWGYGHYFIFSAAAAVGVGLEVCVDYATDHSALSRSGAALTIAVPVAIYLLGVWSLHLQRHQRGAILLLFPIGAAGAIAAAFTPWPVPAIGLGLAALTATVVIYEREVGSHDDEIEIVAAATDG